MGASFALAGLAGCTKQPDEQIFPYVKQPEDLIPGRPMYFATAHPFPTGAIPVLVKADAFRPIKLEGNPEHPVSRGRLDAFTQATLLDLYDPDRSRETRFRGESSSFPIFQQEFGNGVSQLPAGEGLYFLTETSTSPTLGAQWKQVQAKYPQAKLVVWDTVGGDTAAATSQAAFGEALGTQYKLEDADVILSLDTNFLGGIHFPGFLPASAAFAERRRFEPGKPMNRLYTVETMASVTGFKADHRLALKPSEIDAFANALAGGNAPSLSNPDAQKFFSVVLADLKKDRWPLCRDRRSAKLCCLSGCGACAEREPWRSRQSRQLHRLFGFARSYARVGYPFACGRYARRQSEMAGHPRGQPALCRPRRSRLRLCFQSGSEYGAPRHAPG